MSESSPRKNSAPLFSAGWLASLPLAELKQVLAKLKITELQALTQSYEFWARETQREPQGEWRVWLLLSGRGAGKTWTGAHVTNRRAQSGHFSKLLIAAATPAAARDTMIEGESGILATAPAGFAPVYEPSKARLTWPNGVRAYVRSGAEPDRFRGLNTSFAWLDELASWQYPQESWDNAMLGLRLGPKPQAVVTTTPKPIALIRGLLKDPSCIVTRESTYANRPNLSEKFIAEVVQKYEGTRLGRQELHGEVLSDVPGALWRQSLIEVTRREMPPQDQLGRIVIGVDPAVTSSANSNETGILVVGAGKGVSKGHAFVLRDASGRYPASEWPKQLAALYRTLSADRVVAEINNGGDLVEHALRVADPNISYQAVHAARGKRIRAEPVAALYEKGLVHHVGTFRALEDQMTTFIPDERDDGTSPDRVDALVWALTALSLGPQVFIA